MSIDRSTLRRIGGLLLLSIGAFLIQGYHPYAEDAEIYLPGVLKLLNPALFPANAEFFGDHASYSLYSRLIAGLARVSHLPLPWIALLCQFASIFLLLWAAWKLAAEFFEESRARWGAVALMSVLLTLPIAGTALYIHDQYLNPRNLAAFMAVFAVAETLHHRYGRAALWLVVAGAVHPLMASFAIVFCVWLVALDRLRPRLLGLAALLPLGIFDPAPPAYHEVALRQSYFFVLRWEWYEWLGLIGPIVLFWWIARSAGRRGAEKMALVARAMTSYLVVAGLVAMALCTSARLEAVARFEPLRCLALAYMVLIVLGGGLLAQYVLMARAWRWIVLFAPLSVGMFIAQRQLFPASAHIDWPGAQARNPWAQAFEWVRGNTPPDALFALNPRHMALPGEDENGFRARAQRSMLADTVKDKGAASAFPPLATEWLRQFRDQENWEKFGDADFEHLRQKYGVSWIVIEQPGRAGLACPFENSAVRVCQLE